MCMEDIRIGEHSPSEIKSITTDGGQNELLPPNGNRRAFWLSMPEGSAGALNFRPMTGFTDGIHVSGQNEILYMDIDRYGAIIQQGVHLATGVAVTITYGEITLPPKKEFPRDGKWAIQHPTDR